MRNKHRFNPPPRTPISFPLYNTKYNIFALHLSYWLNDIPNFRLCTDLASSSLEAVGIRFPAFASSPSPFPPQPYSCPELISARAWVIPQDSYGRWRIYIVYWFIVTQHKIRTLLTCLECYTSVIRELTRTLTFTTRPSIPDTSPGTQSQVPFTARPI